MIDTLFSKLFGTKNERELKKIWPLVDSINQYFDSYQNLSDGELQQKTEEFRQRLAGEETLDDMNTNLARSTPQATPMKPSRVPMTRAPRARSSARKLTITSRTKTA